MLRKTCTYTGPTSCRATWAVLLIALMGAASPVLAQKAGADQPNATFTALSRPKLVYFDNDFLGPGQSNLQALIPLLHTPGVKLLGVGVVTGDAWLKEEEAHLLRFLEIAGRPDVPVYGGAQMPLIRTQAEMKAWEGRNGRVPWKGAWNPARPGKAYHPDNPDLVPPLVEGTPTLQIKTESAVNFLIKAVHEHPGEVTIIAAGPLTNIALAIRLDPDVPKLAKAIVIQGGYLDNSMARVSGSADYGTDFNFVFDPEAAHIVLTAPWPAITVVGDVTTPIKMTQAIADRIAQPGRPLGTYLKTYARIGQPFWDEITVAVALDPTLVIRSVDAFMDVELQPGAAYGQAQVWSKTAEPSLAPGLGEQGVRIVEVVDAQRFIDTFTQQASQ